MEKDMENQKCERMRGDAPLDFSADQSLVGLWSLIGDRIFYARVDEKGFKVDISRCEAIFSTDPIAYDLLSAVIRKNANAKMIFVHQLHSNSDEQQSMEDVRKKIIEAKNSQIIAHAGSDFVVIIADDPNCINNIYVWVWDLTICK